MIANVADAMVVIREQDAKIASLESRLAKAVEALRPFAKYNLCEEKGQKYRRWCWSQDRDNAIAVLKEIDGGLG